VDDVTWAALTLTLTALGAMWTWFAYQRRGLAAGMRGLAFTLLPVAAYLTQTLEMFTRIFGAVGDWATDLVFNPGVWLGVAVAGISALLFVISGRLRARQLGSAPGTSAVGASDGKSAKSASSAKAVKPTSSKPTKGEPAIDDEMAEIEALLRKRGIS